MIIAYNNAVNSTSLSMTNESPLFPVTNLTDIRLSRFIKVLGTNTRIVFAGSTTVTALFIANHNMTSSATIKLEGNTTNVWTTPAYSATVTYHADVISKLITSATYDYWSVSIDDPTNTEDVKIGGIFIGTYTTFTNTFSHVLTERNIDTTIKSTSLSGQVYTDDNYIYKEYDLNFPRFQLTDVNNLKTILAYIKKKPLYVMLDQTSVTEFAPIYCTIEEASYSRVFTDFYTTSITLQEAK